MKLRSRSIKLFAMHSFVLSSFVAGCSGAVSLTGEEGETVGASSYQAGQSYSLVRDGSGKCMDVGGWGTGDGANIIQWSCHFGPNQKFRVDSLGGAVVRLVDNNSNKCVDVAAAGTADRTNIQLWSCNGTGAQSFILDDMGNGLVRARNTNS